MVAPTAAMEKQNKTNSKIFLFIIFFLISIAVQELRHKRCIYHAHYHCARIDFGVDYLTEVLGAATTYFIILNHFEVYFFSDFINRNWEGIGR